MALNQPFLEQNCRYTLDNCPFNGPEGENCASQFCNGFPATTGTCPQIGLDPDNCCGSSDPASCLEAFVHGTGGGGGGSGGGASANVCASVVGIILSCSSASPQLFPSQTIFNSGPGATALAGCLCYDSDGTYDPGSFDGYASECVSSGSAAHPTYYPYASRLNGICSLIGPASIAASTTAPIPSTATPQTPAATTSEAHELTTQSQSSDVSSSVSRKQSTGPLTPTVSVGATVGSSSVTSKSTSTPSQSGTIRNTLQLTPILLLGVTMLCNLY